MQHKLQLLTVFLITALVFGAVGYFIGNSFSETKVVKESKANDCPDKTFQDGWDAAKERLNETEFLFVGDRNFTEVEGEVLGLNNNSIKISIEPLTPLADPELDKRTLQITEDTGVYRLARIPDSEFQQRLKEYEKEREEYENKMKETESNKTITPPEPPERHDKEKIELANITEGTRIRATANEDIEKLQKFEVTEIIVTNENLRE